MHEAVDVMNAGKSPDLDGVATEYLKNGGRKVFRWQNLCFVLYVVLIWWCIFELFSVIAHEIKKNHTTNEVFVCFVLVCNMCRRVLIKNIRQFGWSD